MKQLNYNPRPAIGEAALVTVNLGLISDTTVCFLVYGNLGIVFCFAFSPDGLLLRPIIEPWFMLLWRPSVSLRQPLEPPKVNLLYEVHKAFQICCPDF